MCYFDCVVIGDIFYDIAVRIKADPKSFFSGGTSYTDFVKPTFGGSGNVAAGISTLGGKTAFVGKAGNDFFAKLYAEDLRSRGVFSRIFLDRRVPTGAVLVFMQENERSFLVFRGANDQLSTNEIGKVDILLRKSSFVYFCGYSLIHNPQKNSVLKAVRLAKKYGAKIVFDPGAYNLVKSDRGFFAKLIDLCNIVSLNLDEAQAITKKTDLRDVITDLRRRVPLVALKCGRRGSVLVNGENTVRTKGYPVRCLDSTGAGDAFTSALIYGLTRQLPLKSIGQLANWFAAQVVKDVGARSFPPSQEIDDFLRRIAH